jgi:hypothetical protein
MVRVSHVIAALVGVILVGWLEWSDGQSLVKLAPAILAWGGLLGMGLWECMSRLPALLDKLLTHKRAK